jgi:hypothetical protein
MTSGGRYVGQFRPEFSRLYRDRDLYWVTPLFTPVMIGVVGERFVGVTTTLEYLRSRHGFRVYTLGGELRRIAEDRGVSIGQRRALQDLGDTLRTETQDAGILARITLRRIRADDRRLPPWSLPRGVVIGGVKTREEMEVFKRMPNFESIRLTVSDDDMRYRRVLKSGDLEEEYEAARLQKEEIEVNLGENPKWSKLKAVQKRDFFDRLDGIHENGHPGDAPEKYRGAPKAAIEAVSEHKEVPNDASFVEFHRNIDAVVRMVRPLQQVLRS